MILFSVGVDRNNQAIKLGQVVRVLDNAKIVKQLMGNAWQNGFQNIIGKIGCVAMFYKNGDVFVDFLSHGKVVITPKALTLATSGKLLYN